MDTETDASVSSETGQRWMRRWAQPLLFPPGPTLHPAWSTRGTKPTKEESSFHTGSQNTPFHTPQESRVPVSVQGNASCSFPK